MEVRHATHPDEFGGLDTAGLRSRFLIEELFSDGEQRLVYGHHDRLVIGGVRPAGGAVDLATPDELRAEFFCQRRELGVVCLDGTGEVAVDAEKHPMAPHDVLYVGRGARDVSFTGDASYYLMSTPAHQTHPTVLARRDEVEAVHLGDQASANVRTIRKYVHADGIASCQLILGITSLAEGSVWNTMPCHTHERRTEAYLYFGLGDDGRVIHLAGPPDATRSMVVADRQAVISPPWSVHCGAGTSHYSFVWAMGGENLDYSDVEVVPVEAMR
ncbi:MAG: 5-dehydro-4-deoxy-D-glucuronate isomerase [Micromonosporaceae bacterium]